MDEIDRSSEAPQEPPDRGAPDQREPSKPGDRPTPQPAWRGDRDGGRRRRGRRGRGGRVMGPPPPFRPGGPAAPEEDEGSAQAREIGAYERRQRQSQQRGGWRGGAAGARPWNAPTGPRPAYAGSGRPPFGGRPPIRGARPPQRYQEMIRRATAGPRVGPPEEAGEPIAGPHAVLEALRAGRAIRRVYVAQERGTRTGATGDVIREAQEKHIQVLFVDRMEVQRLSPGVEHQGVVAIAEGRTGVELEELLLHLETLTEPPLVLVIDSLQDPQNLGVLLRSAEGAGVDGVVIPRHRQVGLTPAVSRTSAGASEHLLIADVANLRQAIDALKERGVWVIGTDDSGELEWDAVDYRGATAIVIGGEGEGIRRLVLEGCDEVVRIPMQGKVSSLNAAAAGTVLLYEALRQRMRDAAPAVADGPSASARVEAGEAEEGAEAEEAPSGSQELATSDETKELGERDEVGSVSGSGGDEPDRTQDAGEIESEVDTAATAAHIATVAGQGDRPGTSTPKRPTKGRSTATAKRMTTKRTRKRGED